MEERQMRRGVLVVIAMCLVAVLTITFADNTPGQENAPTVREDCIYYNREALEVIDEGERGWLLTDGRSRMLGLDNEEDARAALALARRHTAQCFIGRNNRRPNRRDYIVQYWK
jgi:hypothetical protein